MNTARLLANYSPRFKIGGPGKTAHLVRQAAALPAGGNLAVSLKDATFFLYPGEEDMIVGTFTEESVLGKTRQSVRKRQYWALEGTQWKIVSETEL